MDGVMGWGMGMGMYQVEGLLSPLADEGLCDRGDTR